MTALRLGVILLGTLAGLVAVLACWGSLNAAAEQSARELSDPVMDGWRAERDKHRAGLVESARRAGGL